MGVVLARGLCFLKEGLCCLKTAFDVVDHKLLVATDLGGH